MASELISKENPALFNQAIMEFGAMQCVPKNPNCDICIFNTSCLALQKKKVSQLPIKSKKLKVTNRYFNYIVFLDGSQKTIIQKRSDKGIWHNLYEFPLIETQKEESFDAISNQIQDLIYNDNKIVSVREWNPKSIIHKLSHQHLYIKFQIVNLRGSISNGIDFDKLQTYPFPIVIFNFIEKEWKSFSKI